MARYEWNTKYKLLTDNDNLAVELADMKAYLRVTDSSSDDLITDLIKTATIAWELYTGKDLLNKTYTAYLDVFPFFRRYGNRFEENFNIGTILIKKSILQSVTSIKYFTGGVLTTFDNTLYDFTQDDLYARIYLIDDDDMWPEEDERKQAVEIELIAGHGDDSTELPENAKTAIKIMVMYMFENRGDCACVNPCDLPILSGAVPLMNQECVIEI